MSFSKKRLPRAFLLVGHKNWGKSRTLKALTDGRRPRTMIVNGQRLRIRRMSNDDKPEDYEQFVRRLKPGKEPYVLLAYCPEWSPPGREATPLLDNLAGKYELYSFILLESYIGARTMEHIHIKSLRARTVARVSGLGKAKAALRGDALHRFLKRHL